MEVIVNKSPGSSPHVRGALAFHGKRGDGDGIIPACAGSTKIVVWCFLRHWDHPRMCGEHHSSISNWTCGRGIIPACAGSTNLRWITSFGSRDHPRMCGEHATIIGINYTRRGIIPACAGSTAWRSLATP